MSQNDFWPGLLKWSLAQSDGLTPSSDLRPLSDEDKQFINNALTSLIVDEVKRMKIISAILKIPTQNETILKQYLNAHEDALKSLKQLEAKTKDDEEKQNSTTTSSSSSLPDYTSLPISSLLSQIIAKKIEALDELDDRVLTIDNANDLHHVGGLKPLIEHLNVKEQKPEIVWRAAQVVATVAQNNPKAQQWCYEMEAIPALINLIQDTTGINRTNSSSLDNETQTQLLIKALYAISQLVRSVDVPSLSTQFLQHHGLSLLLSLLSTTSSKKLLTKIFSLLRYFLASSDVNVASDTHKVIIENKEAMNKLSEGIGEEEDANLREESMRLLVGIVKRKEGVEEVKKTEYGIEEKVKGRIETLQKMSEEERETWMEELKQWNVIRAVCRWP